MGLRLKIPRVRFYEPKIDPGMFELDDASYILGEIYETDPSAFNRMRSIGFNSNLPEQFSGGYDSQTRDVQIRDDIPYNEAMLTLAHELQHGIQHGQGRLGPASPMEIDSYSGRAQYMLRPEEIEAESVGRAISEETLDRPQELLFDRPDRTKYHALQRAFEANPLIVNPDYLTRNRGTWGPEDRFREAWDEDTWRLPFQQRLPWESQ